VPYGGLAPSLPAVLGGHADAIVSSGYYEYVRSGKLRLLCQTTGMRNKEFPDVPTLKELGYDIETAVFYGIVGPKELPEPLRKKLEEVFTKAAHDPSFAQVVHNAAYTLYFRNSEDWGKHIKEAYKKSEKELRELKLGKFSTEKK
jgi:tripartite-type tricarboxylate transporter receptor subunit TctC